MKILYLEDDDLTREVITDLLRYELPEAVLYHAPDGQEGLDMYDRVQPDLVLTDYRMPEKTGEEVAKELRLRGCKIPIVLLSTTLSDCQDQSLFDDLIRKGDDMMDIVNRLKFLLRDNRSHKT